MQPGNKLKLGLSATLLLIYLVFRRACNGSSSTVPAERDDTGAEPMDTEGLVEIDVVNRLHLGAPVGKDYLPANVVRWALEQNLRPELRLLTHWRLFVVRRKGN